jgi:hypothetical protein
MPAKKLHGLHHYLDDLRICSEDIALIIGATQPHAGSSGAQAGAAVS